MPTVQVEGLGNVSFPDGTPEADMTKAVQEALTQKNAPAPLSGPIGEPPIPKAMQDTPESNNRAALQSGLIGTVKSIPQTVADVGGLVNKIPRFGESIAPGAEVNAFRQMAQADNPQEEAGKIFGAGLQSLIPIGGAADAMPSTARAGKVFEDVMGAAGSQPVNLTRAMQPLERAQQLSARGHGSVSALDNLYKRVNTTNPLDYREARDWASSLSRLSANDKMAASPSLQRQVGQLSHAFNADVGDAASAAGKGPEYAQAMREFRQGSQLKSAVKGAAKYAIPAAAGGGAIGYGLKKVMQ